VAQSIFLKDLKDLQAYFLLTQSPRMCQDSSCLHNPHAGQSPRQNIKLHGDPASPQNQMKTKNILQDNAW